MLAETLRRQAEWLRATAEKQRLAATAQFDTVTRKAIREELEVSAEMQKSANAIRRDRHRKHRRR